MGNLFVFATIILSLYNGTGFSHREQRVYAEWMKVSEAREQGDVVGRIYN